VADDFDATAAFQGRDGAAVDLLGAICLGECRDPRGSRKLNITNALGELVAVLPAAWNARKLPTRLVARSGRCGRIACRRARQTRPRHLCRRRLHWETPFARPPRLCQGSVQSSGRAKKAGAGEIPGASPTEFWWLVEAHRPVKMYESVSEDDVARIHDKTFGPH